MAGVDLSGAEEETLAGAVVKMRRVNLDHTCLTIAQVNIIFQRILKEENRVLETLHLWRVDLVGVERNLVDRVRAVVTIRTRY